MKENKEGGRTTVSQNPCATASAVLVSAASHDAMMHVVVLLMNASDWHRQFKSSEKQLPVWAFWMHGLAQSVIHLSRSAPASSIFEEGSPGYCCLRKMLMLAAEAEATTAERARKKVAARMVTKWIMILGTVSKDRSALGVSRVEEEVKKVARGDC